MARRQTFSQADDKCIEIESLIQIAEDGRADVRTGTGDADRVTGGTKRSGNFFAPRSQRITFFRASTTRGKSQDQV